MATGSGLSTLIPVAMTLAGLVTMLRARARRNGGPVPADKDFERRQGAAMEMERRMASYLAQRETGSPSEVPADDMKQETRR